MPSRIEDFENHNIHVVVTKLRGSLGGIRDEAAADPDLLLYWNRSQQVFDLTISVLDRTDPAFVPRSVLDELASGLSNLEQHLSSYVAQEPREQIYLDNADQAVDAILIGLVKLRVPADAHEVEGIAAAATTLRRSAGQLANNLAVEIDELRGQIDTLSTQSRERQTEIEGQRGQIESAIQQFQEQETISRQALSAEFIEAQDDRRKQFSEMQEERRGQFSTEMNEQRERFATSLRDRESQLDALIEEVKTKQQSVLAAADAAFSEAESRTQDTSVRILGQLAEYKQQAEELVNTTAMTGMAGGYKRVADTHLRASRIWQILAVAAMLGLVFFLYELLHLSLAAEVSWVRLASRIFVASGIGVLAAYAARQADRHQENERFNRQQELELASLSLYLAGMSDEEQHKAKLQLIERLFGQAQAVSPIKDAMEAGGVSVLELFKLVLEAAAGKGK